MGGGGQGEVGASRQSKNIRQRFSIHSKAAYRIVDKHVKQTFKLDTRSPTSVVIQSRRDGMSFWLVQQLTFARYRSEQALWDNLGYEAGKPPRQHGRQPTTLHLSQGRRAQLAE